MVYLVIWIFLLRKFYSFAHYEIDHLSFLFVFFLSSFFFFSFFFGHIFLSSLYILGTRPLSDSLQVSPTLLVASPLCWLLCRSFSFVYFCFITLVLKSHTKDHCLYCCLEVYALLFLLVSLFRVLNWAYLS